MTTNRRLYVGGTFHGQIMDLPEVERGLIRFAQPNLGGAVSVNDKGLAYNSKPFEVQTYVFRRLALADTYGETTQVEVMVIDELTDERLPETLATQALTSAVLDASLRAIYSTEEPIDIVSANGAKTLPPDPRKTPLAASETADLGFPG